MRCPGDTRLMHTTYSSVLGFSHCLYHALAVSVSMEPLPDDIGISGIFTFLRSIFLDLLGPCEAPKIYIDLYKYLYFCP